MKRCIKSESARLSPPHTSRLMETGTISIQRCQRRRRKPVAVGFGTTPPRFSDVDLRCGRRRASGLRDGVSPAASWIVEIMCSMPLQCCGVTVTAIRRNRGGQGVTERQRGGVKGARKLCKKCVMNAFGRTGCRVIIVVAEMEYVLGNLAT